MGTVKANDYEHCSCKDCIWGGKCLNTDNVICDDFCLASDSVDEDSEIGRIIELNRNEFEKEWSEYMDKWGSDSDE